MDIGKKFRGLALGAFATVSAVTGAAQAQDNNMDTPEIGSVPIPQERPERTQDQNNPPSEADIGYQMIDPVFNAVLNGFGLNSNDLQFIPETKLGFDSRICYDENNNGIADRDISYEHYVIEDGKTRQEFVYGDIAEKRIDLDGIIVYDDMTTTDFDGANMTSIVNYMKGREGQSSTAIIFDKMGDTKEDGTYPISYVVSVINGQAAVAMTDAVPDSLKPNESWCDTLKKPAPNTPG